MPEAPQLQPLTLHSEIDPDKHTMMVGYAYWYSLATAERSMREAEREVLQAAKAEIEDLRAQLVAFKKEESGPAMAEAAKDRVRGLVRPSQG